MPLRFHGRLRRRPLSAVAPLQPQFALVPITSVT
jgi:hypothetical protein